MDTVELDLYFRNILDMDIVKNIDSSMNGFQVDQGKNEVHKVAFAVDASLETFKMAKDWNADVIFVHHGLFWGHPIAVTNNHYDRLSFLIKNNLSLYAAHLPLDMNPLIGNNYGIAKKLDLQNIQPFGSYKGVKIGASGTLIQAKTIDEILDILETNRKEALGVLPFGNKKISTVAVVSGGATREITQAMEQKMDLYITGDLSHETYHTCLEGGINMISAGHYFTETFGPKLLSEKLKRDKTVDTVFIDVPTGL
ncbi:MAG: Nif3-like dinuclear metal center hexameric protein [Spirochaetia bacterium]|jgi:dinuclear metal center YbgI/SA1388 family protein|nr:Nif3-like dinuclear metal center hexameric protein [Spirochaetia bacterium]